jgi:hypothetical protein
MASVYAFGYGDWRMYRSGEVSRPSNRQLSTSMAWSSGSCFGPTRTPEAMFSMKTASSASALNAWRTAHSTGARSFSASLARRSSGC